MSYSLKNNEQGFTAVELVVGLAISLVLLGVAVKIFLVQQRSYNVQEQLAEMQQNIRSAMDMIVRETKMAGYDPNGSFDGIGTSTTQLQISADFDGSGVVTVTYLYDADNLQIERDIGGGGQPLAENIQAFTFDYYDANEGPATTSSDIRQIRISITGRTAKIDPDLQRVDGIGYRYGTLTTRVTPANLGF